MNDDVVLQQDFQNPLSRPFDLFSLLRFAFPTIFMMVFVGMYTIVDTIFVARFIHTNALSSINIVCPAINLITGVGAMLPYCHIYLMVLLLFLPVNLLQLIFQTLFVTAGKPGLGFLLALVAGLINITFDYIFIAKWRIGIAGAAISDGIGFLIIAVSGILFFMRKKEVLHFSLPKFDLKLIIESAYNGSSEMVGQLSTAITTIFFNGLMMRYLGEEGVAGITIIIYSQFLLSTLYIGFSIGVAPIISYHYGSQNHAQLKKIFRMCIFLILLTSIFIFIVSILFAPHIVRFFSAEGSNVYCIALEGFFIFSFNFLFCGCNIFSSAFFTALSNGKVSALISFLRTFGFITTGLLILPNLFSVRGIWLAIPLAELLTFFFSITFLFLYRNKYEYM